MLNDTLSRFVASDRRDVAAVREAIKRAGEWLAGARSAVAERLGTVQRSLSHARERISAVEQAAAKEIDAVRQRFAAFEATLARITSAHAAAANRVAGEVRRGLRHARWAWCRSGHSAVLDADVERATATYTEAAAQICTIAQHGVNTATADHETEFAVSSRPPTPLRYGPLSPETRAQDAIRGRAQLLRRALWQRWYVPGLLALERTTVAVDVQDQTAWLADAVASARRAAQATLDERLTEITGRADAKIQEIKEQSAFTALEAELARLNADVPVIEAQCAAIAGLAREMKALADA